MTPRISATAFDQFDRMFDYDEPEDSFLGALGLTEREPMGEPQILGSCFHNAMQQAHEVRYQQVRSWDGRDYISGFCWADGERQWRDFQVEDCNAILDEAPHAHRSIPETKMVIDLGPLRVVTIADLYAPGLEVVDWKSALKKKSLDPEWWIKSWQWRISLVALQCPVFRYVGAHIVEKRSQPRRAELVTSYACEAYETMEAEVREKAQQIRDWIDKRDLAIPDIAERFRYGRPD